MLDESRNLVVANIGQSSLRPSHLAHDPRTRKVLGAPVCNVAQQVAKAHSFPGKPVAVAPLIGGLRFFFDQAELAQSSQPGGEDVRGDSLGRLQEIIEVPAPAQEVTHDQERPAVSNDVESARDRTVGSATRFGFFPALHPEILLAFRKRFHRMLADCK